MKLDRAQAQLGRLTNDASLISRPQGLVLLNPIAGGKNQPVAVRRNTYAIFKLMSFV